MSRKSKIKKQAHPPTNHQSSGEDTLSDKQCRVHIDGGKVETNFPAEFVKKYESGQTEQASRENKKYKVEIATLVIVGLYTLVSLMQVCLTQKALKLTEEASRGIAVFGDTDLTKLVQPGERIGIAFSIKNIGHSQIIYGFKTEAHRWKTLPDGDMPIVVDDISKSIEAGGEDYESVFDIDFPDRAFIDELPTIDDLTWNAKTGDREPPSRTLTVFFIGKIVYDSMGKRREREFCNLVVRQRVPNELHIGGPKFTDPNFFLSACPKWNKGE
jgi:hypothetical protein